MRSSRSEIEENINKTKKLIVYFILLFIGIGCLLSLVLYATLGKDFSIKNAVLLVIFFLLGSSIYTFIAFKCMNKIALGGLKGIEITENNMPEVYHIVEELSLAARIPMPKVYLVKDPSPNAFATGPDPQHATVSVTYGLLKMMNREELEAVIGHELSHIKNYDIRVSTLAASLSSVIVGVGVMLIVTARFIFDTNFWLSDDDNDKGSFESVILVFGIGILLVGVIIKVIGLPIARLIELAISRQREYLADVSSTQLTHNPRGMIKALEVLKNDETPTTKNLTIVRQLCLTSPKYMKIGKRVKKFSGFDTHPPLEDRIKRIQQLMGGKS